ncbi:sigma-70 family RNA polymerase sigma factor [Ruminococcus sp.]|uniref:RNA polymerase sigma factor n=1 Tax=Ruminococcus sp. TaxID=41978 RepID=UPI0025E98CF5|nr:sigma-70 family RNA polymerase sigma factor [Ruminococcus sp.]MCR4639890.1 sigma-70 family RNA polymerase sigma factor [Ruminococcus sp.]
MTSSELKALYQRSVTDCHRALMQEYGRYVYSIIFNKLRVCGTREDIEECFSDVFADIFIKLDDDRLLEGDIKALIGTVAKRSAIGRFRSLTAAQKHIASTDDEDMERLASDISVEAHAEGSELRRLLLCKIRELGEPDATILIQKYYYNRRSDEIAANVSMTASSVRSRCTRAMEKLRVKLAEIGITE